MFLLLGLALALAAPVPAVDPSQYQALRYRLLGPSRGGRSTAVTGIPGRPHTFFAGSSGGLWKTDDAGMTWRSISDGFFESGSIGAVAVADADPNVVYAGTGQAYLRGNVSAGVGDLPVDGRRPRHGRTRAFATSARSPGSGSIRGTRIFFYVAAVGRAFGPKTRSGACSARRTAGSPGRRPSRSARRPGPRAKNGRREPARPLRRGVDGASASRGRSSPEAPRAASTNRPTAATAGSSSRAACPRASSGQDRRGGLARRPGPRLGSGRSRRTTLEGFTAPTTRARTWRRLETNARRRLYQRTWYYQAHRRGSPGPQPRVRDERG